MDQNVTWYREVGLDPSNVVLDGDPALLPQKGTPQFSAHVYCSQTAGWIRMPLGTEVGLGYRRRCYMGTQLPLTGARLPVFGPCLLWPNGWMDEDATCYGSRRRPRPHCVRRGPSSPRANRGHISSPSFRPMSVVVTVAHLSY